MIKIIHYLLMLHFHIIQETLI